MNIMVKKFIEKEAQNVNRNVIITFACIFSIFYILNSLIPRAFGDDYLYAFIWQGHSMFTPLTEDAVRISSLKDIFVSQWSHYLTWSGRAVSHTLIQFFLWMGKPVFNIFNAAISVLLIAEIYWCAHKGKISVQFNAGIVCWIAFMLWAFTPGFSGVFLWISGACNYLWTAVFLLTFLLPYIRKYYCFEDTLAKNGFFKCIMFMLGIIAGWSNENSICWIVLLLMVFLFVNRKRKEMESWMYSGLAGLIAGYALLMLAPGNVARLHVELTNMNAEIGSFMSWFNAKLIGPKIDILIAVLTFQFLLWYFCLRSLYLLKNEARKDKEVKEECLLLKAFLLVSFCMTFFMIFSPLFLPRSSFPGTVQLVIAATVLLRIQDEYTTEIIKKGARKFLCAIGVLYTVVTVSATFYGFYNYHNQVEELLSFVQNSKEAKEHVITVNALTSVSEPLENASGLHILSFEMSEDENFWSNVAFSRYYGIKGIRMVKHKTEQQ